MKNPKLRVSILPFFNGADPSWDYLAEGMTDLCSNSLIEIETLQVVSSGNGFKGGGYDEILRAIEVLKVDVVIIGEVHVDDKLSLQLYAYEGGGTRPIWSNMLFADLKQILSFGEQLKDFVLSKFNSGIATPSNQLNEKLLPLNKEAYRTYLLGNFYLNKWDLGYIMLAHSQFEKVIEIEPDFVPAYLGLAKSTVFKVSWGRVAGDQAYPQVLEMLDRMILINPNFGDLYIHKGIIEYFHFLDWDSAFRNIENGLPLAVDKVEGYTQLSMFWYGMREYDKALDALHVALEYDPLSIGLINMKGDLFISSEQYDLAEVTFKELLDLQPGDKRTLENLMYVSILKKDVDKTRKYLYLLTKVGETPFFDYPRQGLAYALLGQDDKLEEMFKEFVSKATNNTGTNYYSRLSALYVAKGDWENVMDCLEKSMAVRSGVIYILTEPILKPIRNWDRYKALLKDIKPPQNVGGDKKVTIQTELKTSIDINPNSMLYAKSEENYTTLFLYNNFRTEEVLLRISLKSLIDQLPSGMFFQCHRSYVVNRELSFSTAGNSRGHTLTSLEHGFDVPVSRSKVGEMKKLIG